MQRYAILFSPLLFCTGSKSGRAYACITDRKFEIDDDWVLPTLIAEGREAAHMLLRLYDEQPSAAQRGIRDILSIWESASTNHHDIRR